MVLNKIKITENAEKRLSEINATDPKTLEVTVEKRKEVRIPFGNLIEKGLLNAGEKLISPCKKFITHVRADGSITSQEFSGSIHKVGAMVQGAPSCNGWTLLAITEC